jgi:dipeptidyl aminopeptidase/acylaminoacyl peptidase
MISFVARLSPDGQLVAFFADDVVLVGNPEQGYSGLRKFPDNLSIQELTWIGPQTIWIESWNKRKAEPFFTALKVELASPGDYDVIAENSREDWGYVHDRLVDDPDYIVFAKPSDDDGVVVADLYRINVFESTKDNFRRRNRINTGSEDYFYYEQNSAGDYVLGIRFIENVPEVWRRLPGGDWENIWTSDSEVEFIPWSLAADDTRMWVLTNALTDKVAAVEFDLDRREFGRILFQHDRVDVEAILFSPDSDEPIGVIYTEQGLVRYEYFDELRKSEFENLQANFPGQGVILVGISEQSDTRLVLASSPKDPGALHFCDESANGCEIVEKLAPWLDRKPLSDTVALSIPSTDGFVVDAFLTLPVAGGDLVPLVALPHGGPIGISDSRYFSPEVQWLASNGYAVIQVNYRGSGGYGKEFEAAGLRQWGRGIEDDIEAAVNHALEHYPQLDGNRVGIFGGSYGGYSALMSVIRNPDLFKCAASWAGVTDLTLLFTQTSMHRNEGLRNQLIKYVGDPDVDYEEQTMNSPVYRYQDIRRPVLLGHGTDDIIVDIEHSWRMRKMMSLAGVEPEFVRISGVGHGFSLVGQSEDFYEPLLEFLDEHLKPKEPGEPTNETAD